MDAAGFLGEVVVDFGLAPPEAELGVIPLSLAFANKSLIPLRSLYSHKTIERSIQIKIYIFERSTNQIIVVLELSFLFSIESDSLNTQSKSKEKKGPFEKPFKLYYCTQNNQKNEEKTKSECIKLLYLLHGPVATQILLLEIFGK